MPHQPHYVFPRQETISYSPLPYLPSTHPHLPEVPQHLEFQSSRSTDRYPTKQLPEPHPFDDMVSSFKRHPDSWFEGADLSEHVPFLQTEFGSVDTPNHSNLLDEGQYRNILSTQGTNRFLASPLDDSPLSSKFSNADPWESPNLPSSTSSHGPKVDQSLFTAATEQPAPECQFTFNSARLRSPAALASPEKLEVLVAMSKRLVAVAAASSAEPPTSAPTSDSHSQVSDFGLGISPHRDEPTSGPQSPPSQVWQPTKRSSKQEMQDMPAKRPRQKSQTSSSAVEGEKFMCENCAKPYATQRDLERHIDTVCNPKEELRLRCWINDCRSKGVAYSTFRKDGLRKHACIKTEINSGRLTSKQFDLRVAAQLAENKARTRAEEGAGRLSAPETDLAGSKSSDVQASRVHLADLPANNEDSESESHSSLPLSTPDLFGARNFTFTCPPPYASVFAGASYLFNDATWQNQSPSGNVYPGNQSSSNGPSSSLRAHSWGEDVLASSIMPTVSLDHIPPAASLSSILKMIA